MKKTIVTLFVIALIGLIGVVDKTQGSTHQLVSPSSTGAAISPTTSASSGSSNSSAQAGATTTGYKDGTYTGSSAQTPYGTVQIAVVVSGGKITDVNFLQMPNDLSSSQERTQYSEPLLKQTTIAKQSANIDFVSGATSTSEGYQMSLQSALNQAAVS